MVTLYGSQSNKLTCKEIQHFKTPTITYIVIEDDASSAHLLRTLDKEELSTDFDYDRIYRYYHEKDQIGTPLLMLLSNMDLNEILSTADRYAQNVTNILTGPSKYEQMRQCARYEIQYHFI